MTSRSAVAQTAWRRATSRATPSRPAERFGSGRRQARACAAVQRRAMPRAAARMRRPPVRPRARARGRRARFEAVVRVAKAQRCRAMDERVDEVLRARPRPEAGRGVDVPASPRFTNALPRCCASVRASPSGIHGSVSLPITIDGTGSRRASNGPANVNFFGLAGATSSTPATSPVCGHCASTRPRGSRSSVRRARTAAFAVEQRAHRLRPAREIGCVPVVLFDAQRARNCRSSQVCQ